MVELAMPPFNHVVRSHSCNNLADRCHPLLGAPVGSKMSVGMNASAIKLRADCPTSWASTLSGCRPSHCICSHNTWVWWK